MVESSTMAEWANIIAALAAAIGLIFTAVQLRKANSIARAQFWLQLEQMFTRHDALQEKLQEGGEWQSAGIGPAKPQDWVAVYDYMGLFEHCEIMLEQKLIDDETFKQIFGYRLKELVSNATIVQGTLGTDSDNWRRFLSLLDRVGIERPSNPPMQPTGSAGG